MIETAEEYVRLRTSDNPEEYRRVAAEEAGFYYRLDGQGWSGMVHKS